MGAAAGLKSMTPLVVPGKGTMGFPGVSGKSLSQWKPGGETPSSTQYDSSR